MQALLPAMFLFGLATGLHGVDICGRISTYALRGAMRAGLLCLT